MSLKSVELGHVLPGATEEEKLFMLGAALAMCRLERFVLEVDEGGSLNPMCDYGMKAETHMIHENGLQWGWRKTLKVS